MSYGPRNLRISHLYLRCFVYVCVCLCVRAFDLCICVCFVNVAYAVFLFRRVLVCVFAHMRCGT